VNLHLKPPQRAPDVRRRFRFQASLAQGLACTAAYRVHLRAGWSFHHGLDDVEYVSVFASKNYEPRPYAGRVLLLRRGYRPGGDYRDPAYG
jgi:hypothetical protein